MEIEDIKDKLENKIVALATIQDNKPHTIVVEVNKIIDNKIIITNNQMKNTPKNIKINPNISIVFWENEDGWRVEGEAEYYNSGKWLKFVESLPENKNYKPRGVIIINVKSVKKLG